MTHLANSSTSGARGATPGPWETDEAEHDEPYQPIRVKAGRRQVCSLWLDDAPVPDFNTEQRVNARLIAAAPELLAALDALVNSFETHRPKRLWDDARQAIAKARGQ